MDVRVDKTVTVLRLVKIVVDKGPRVALALDTAMGMVIPSVKFGPASDQDVDGVVDLCAGGLHEENRLDAAAEAIMHVGDGIGAIEAL
ncbi:hypothetical protein Daus18300_012885 [Diaporthe australafricana]|uniref:Uncharacterized protein n=1 Tax=Diaporthe australafricana TaxID=127596 RepID=A0ABR3W157_9PEZI